MDEDEDLSKLSKLSKLPKMSKMELSILRGVYQNKSIKKIANALSVDQGTIKESLMNLSSRGYVKYKVGILRDKYRLTEKGLNTLIQKDASVRRSVTSDTPLQDDKPIFKEYRPRRNSQKGEKKERKLIRKLKREG